MACADPEECPQAEPRKSNQVTPRQNLLEPGSTLHMLGRPWVVRVEQQICVNENHRWSGPSTCSRSSATLWSERPGRRPPRSLAFTANGSAVDVERRTIKPRRRVSLTTSRNGLPDFLD